MTSVTLLDHGPDISRIENSIHQTIPSSKFVCYDCIDELKNHFADIDVNTIFIINLSLNEENIIDFVKEINHKFKNAPIIYLCDDGKLISEIYETNHCYCLKKEQIEKTLPKALAKATQQIHDLGAKLKLNLKNRMIFIPNKEILYMERRMHKTSIYTSGEMIETPLKISELLEQLSDEFVRTHASYIVNSHYIKEFRRTQIHLTNGKYIPISRTYWPGLRMMMGDLSLTDHELSS